MLYAYVYCLQVFEELSGGFETLALGAAEVNSRAYCSWFGFSGQAPLTMAILNYLLLLGAGTTHAMAILNYLLLLGTGAAQQALCHIVLASAT